MGGLSDPGCGIREGGGSTRAGGRRGTGGWIGARRSRNSARSWRSFGARAGVGGARSAPLSAMARPTVRASVDPGQPPVRACSARKRSGRWPCDAILRLPQRRPRRPRHAVRRLLRPACLRSPIDPPARTAGGGKAVPSRDDRAAVRPSLKGRSNAEQVVGAADLLPRSSRTCQRRTSAGAVIASAASRLPLHCDLPLSRRQGGVDGLLGRENLDDLAVGEVAICCSFVRDGSGEDGTRRPPAPRIPGRSRR